MDIISLSSPEKTGTPSDLQRELYDEVPTAIFINGKHVSTILLAPGNQEEYFTGFLFTEQYISKIEEIESIRPEKNRISVLTTNIFTSPGPKKTILSGCGGAVSYVDPGKLPVISSDFSVSVEDLKTGISGFNAFNRASSNSPSISSLFLGPEVLYQRSDIGDEQVTDRIIGAALMGSINFSTTWCMSTVIITSEIVRKCLIVGIPLILTASHLTKLAQEIGQKNGICIASLQNDSLVIYAHPERIIR
ncbi:formate dehydrogenase accessory sulfurtransferase FdhD [Methanospirillum stamsii]|nr:formate dehydrogenase accessory sulfurtransferase FdhD [Methanospirillum stamsii]